jgi:hypothetical protein
MYMTCYQVMYPGISISIKYQVSKIIMYVLCACIPTAVVLVSFSLYKVHLLSDPPVYNHYYYYCSSSNTEYRIQVLYKYRLQVPDV